MIQENVCTFDDSLWKCVYFKRRLKKICVLIAIVYRNVVLLAMFEESVCTFSDADSGIWDFERYTPIMAAAVDGHIQVKRQLFKLFRTYKILEV